MSVVRGRPKCTHPGRTPAQRRVLDAIGCGNFSPIMSPKTRDALLAAGLIEQLSDTIMGSGPFAVRVPQFQMPVHVHIAWCVSVGEDEPS